MKKVKTESEEGSKRIMMIIRWKEEKINDAEKLIKH